MGQILMQRLTVIGFIVSDELELFPAAFEHLSGMLAAGKLHYDETIVDSFENALDALGQLSRARTPASS